jgi:hypothetical protein
MSKITRSSRLADTHNQYIDGERSRIAAANGVDMSVKGNAACASALRMAKRWPGSGTMQQVFIDRLAAGRPLPVVSRSRRARSLSAPWVFGNSCRPPSSYMRVDRLIDERRDPLESTRAAAAYLDQAYGSLGNWPLAITSYNYGQTGMARAVAQIGSSNLVDLIQRYNHPYWGFAPKQFYAEFLAAVEIGKNFNQYFPGIEQDAPRKIQEVTLARNTSLSTAVGATGLSQEEFMEWNPALSANVRVLPAGYRVKLPSDRSVEPIVEVAQVNYQAPAAAPRRAASSQAQQRQAAN